MASTCSTCDGTGSVIPRGSECKSCSGEGVVRERKTLTVEVPGGVEDGMRLRVTGEGDAARTGRAPDSSVRGTNGDLHVLIRVAADPKFSRTGADIHYTASIPMTTAILGGSVTVPTLDGEVNVKVATGTTTGDKMTLSGMGMAKLGSRRGGFGDLKVEFKVHMPKYLTANQRTIVEMLAEEMGDKTAKRVMNINWAKDDKAADADSHKNEGFLKSIWHNLTNHPAHQKKPDPEPEKPASPETKEAPKDSEPEEPKKGSGSG